MSNYDVNLFSSKDKGNDRAFATKVQFIKDATKIRLFQKPFLMQTKLGYEFVQDRFRAVERLRNVEFLRDWSLPYDISLADEHIINGSVKVADTSGNYLAYEAINYNRSDKYNGLRQTLNSFNNYNGWQLTNQFSLTTIHNPKQDGTFIRPTVDLRKELTQLKKMQVGLKYNAENNNLRDKKTDTLSA